ncbi:unnamed protein product [Acanthoscelides obtectus]|uniref:Uncharacterized protein n=1 Tax=Acanthoscelides obtectus TaxID=200917 RepID=A0A9P0K5U2_ACAOB|nr:unnamed protein product [Acanthoscelides obtectus]CAK1626776.1 hypothetical protein AOBTE_LOCUS4070 [Acanthoscelides obtectus]
MFDVRLCDH